VHAYGYSPQQSSGDVPSIHIKAKSTIVLTFTDAKKAGSAPLLLYLQHVPAGTYVFQQTFIIGSSANGVGRIVGNTLVVAAGKTFNGILVFNHAAKNGGTWNKIQWTGNPNLATGVLDFTLAWIASPTLTISPTGNPIPISVKINKSLTLRLRATLPNSQTPAKKGTVRITSSDGTINTIQLSNSGRGTYVTPKFTEPGSSFLKFQLLPNLQYAASSEMTVLIESS